MREKLVLIGAGSAMFTRGLIADIIRNKWQGELGLVDIDGEALSVAEGLARKMIQAGKARLKLTATQDRRSVLKGATAVVCTIGVGGRRAWEKDVYIPRRHGIYYPVGDTVGPGGTSRALRMIPPMVEVARDVLDLCPQALFFNYGNPMAAVCRAVRKATGASMAGLCHGVFHIGEEIAKELDVPPQRLKYAAVGMNHMTWFTEVRVDGLDAMGRLRDLARRKLGLDASGRGGEVPADLRNRFCWELMELMGAFPAVADAHVTEFFPHLFARKGSYYGKTLGVDVISTEQIIGRGDEVFAQLRKVALSGDPLPADFLSKASGEHEQVTEIIASIRGDEGRVYSANLPNTSQVPNLPREAILEGPAVAGGAGLRAIAQPPLPPALAGTLASRLQWVETVVEAALEGSRQKFIQALLLDGAVDSVPAARLLADDLLAAHAEHLPQFPATKTRKKQAQ